MIHDDSCQDAQWKSGRGQENTKSLGFSIKPMNPTFNRSQVTSHLYHLITLTTQAAKQHRSGHW